MNILDMLFLSLISAAAAPEVVHTDESMKAHCKLHAVEPLWCYSLPGSASTTEQQHTIQGIAWSRPEDKHEKCVDTDSQSGNGTQESLSPPQASVRRIAS